jgi:hypothetical protein
VRLLAASLLIAACGAFAASAAGMSPAHAASLKQKFFLSPSGNISCELDYDPGGSGGLPTQAFCETITPARSVVMKPSGKLKICNGTQCLGNPPENAFTLAYGQKATLGPFTCQSRPTGMRCRTDTGHGFVISRGGIQRI